MKKTVLTVFAITLCAFSHAQYQVVTIVESIVPGGVGRSRMIENGSPADYNQFTTTRTEGKDSKQGDIDRGDLKISSFKETKMLNFFSMV